MKAIYPIMYLVKVILVLSQVFLGGRALAADTEIKIGGTGNALGGITILANAFASANPGIKPVIFNSIGSSGAIKGTLKNVLDLGLSSRPPSEVEKQAGITCIEYARTPTVLAVQAQNSVSSVSLKQVADILSGKLTKWPDGVLIRPVLRQQGDDNTKQLKELSPEIESGLMLAEARPALPFAVTDQDAADLIESTPGSFGVTTLALILSERRRIKPLALDGVTPTQENSASGAYSMIKRLYLILPKDPSTETLKFIDFIKSKEGTTILQTYGCIVP